MDNYMGDLTDIVRASGTGGSQEPVPAGKWGQFPADSNGLASMTNNSSSSIEDNFGDPFSDLRDPLLHGLDVPNSVFFGGSGLVGADGEVFVPGMMNRQQQPPNMYTRMLQMTGDPTTAKLSIGEQPVLAGTMMKEIKVSSMATLGHRSDVSIRVDKSKGCLVESTGTMQISSPTNSGIKRRKSQAKKVVCIPAPAAVNSRASGEVVPSDLWAWRKYGQKPIKGSPYPRGYYRCSSSKGCPARKQVERSRTDPNMLVITYTSEHNHPWPTQRNALAGSTRSQPSKSNNGGATPKTSHSPPLQKSSTTGKEHKEIDSSSLTTLNAGGSSATSASIKEEAEDFQRHTEMEMEMDDGHELSADFSHSYRPSEPDEANRGDDFFADLGEISGDDPLNLLFSQGFSGDGQKEARGLDPFSIFGWSSIEDQNTTFNEVKRDVFTTRP